MTPEDRAEIEEMINRRIQQNVDEPPVSTPKMREPLPGKSQRTNILPPFIPELVLRK